MAKLSNLLKRVKLSFKQKENPDFEDFVELPRKYLKVVGLTFGDGSQQPSSKKEKLIDALKKLHRAFVAFLLFLFVSSNFISALVHFNTKRLPINSFIFLLLTMTAFVKYLELVIKRNKFCGLMMELKELFLENKDVQVKIGKLHMKSFVARSYECYNYAFTAVTLLAPCIEYFFTGVWNDPSIDELWFPFIDGKAGILLAYLWRNVGTIVGVVVLYEQFWIYAAMTNLLAINFDILRADFEALNNAKAQNFKDQLVELIKRHQKLLSLAKRIVRLFAFANAAEFCINTLMLGLVSFIMAQLLKMRLCFVLAVLTFQVIAQVWRMFLFCNQAQKVIDGSESIADAAYCSGWEKLEEKAPKDMIRLVILRSQRPVKIRAMRFVVISMEAMTLVSK